MYCINEKQPTIKKKKTQPLQFVHAEFLFHYFVHWQSWTRRSSCPLSRWIFVQAGPGPPRPSFPWSSRTPPRTSPQSPPDSPSYALLLGPLFKEVNFFTNNLFISKSLNTHWHYRKLSSSWSKDVLTFLLSPGNKLWIIHSLLTFDSHKLSQISVMIDDSEQFLHLCIVLLLVFVCSLFQKYHLGLSFIPDFKNSQSCK